MNHFRRFSQIIYVSLFALICLFVQPPSILAQAQDGAGNADPSIERHELDEPAIIRTGKDLINIRLTDESLENVINIFTKMLGVNIIAMPSDLEGRVTVNLSGVEWKPTLSAILDMHNLRLVEKTAGSGLFSVVRKTPDEGEPMVVETLYLKHKTVAEVSVLLNALMKTNASVLEFSSGNAMVVKATEANLSEIRSVVASIDIQGKQICVETKFMEINEEASKQIGIDWQMLEGLTISAETPSLTISETRRKTRLDDRGTATSDTRRRTRLDDSGTTTVSADDVASESSFDVSGANIRSLEVGADGTITRESVLPVDRSEVRAAILNIDSFRVILSALQKTDGVSVVSNPKMLVASGITNAVFRVGSRYPIIKTTRTNRGQDEGITDRTVELDTSVNTDFITSGYLQTGIELRVIPVAKTDDMIEAQIIPRLIRKTGDSTPIDGNSWPILSIKEIDTTFTLRSGQTIAIGGLTSTTDKKKTSKIPLLGSIPVIGRLFSHTYDSQEQVETIVFVTLSLAGPEVLGDIDGMPDNAELVHKRMLESKARKHRFQIELKKLQEMPQN